MDSNDNNRASADDVIVLGVASVETKGSDLGFEPVGKIPTPGISEE
ncbi:benenodin family lasso peptide [Stenotrophomonas sp. MYb238]|nr:benenodin family lasso peptide [Stenotrophomonas sp. MYb238]MQP74292.1 benenodin family lasso peptide [Stenotrophomonas sp. MYb238]